MGIVTSTGGTNNDQVDQWRSTGQVKTLDINGDNVYGTDGYVLYATDTVGNVNGGAVTTVDPLTDANTRISVPSYLALSNNGQARIARSYAYQQVDDPSLTVTTSVADVEAGGALREGIARDTEASLANITIGTGAPTTMRIGIIAGLADSFTGNIRLTQTTGGSTSVSFTRSTTSSIYFVDLTGAVAGDVFTLFLSKDASAGGNNNLIYNGFTFDSVPEPSAPLLGGLAMAAMAVRRRRN